MTFDSDYEPWFQPPSFIIGPVWLVLYSMLAVSFCAVIVKTRIYCKAQHANRPFPCSVSCQSDVAQCV